MNTPSTHQMAHPGTPVGGDLEEVAWARTACRTGQARQIREAAHLTTGDLASELNVSPAAVSQWENNIVTPRRRHAVPYARLLRMLAKYAKEPAA